MIFWSKQHLVDVSVPQGFGGRGIKECALENQELETWYALI
jgi:hypothetical protein